MLPPMAATPTKAVPASRASMASAPHTRPGSPEVRSVHTAPAPEPAFVVAKILPSLEHDHTTLGSLGATLRSVIAPRPAVRSPEMGVQMAAPSLDWYMR